MERVAEEGRKADQSESTDAGPTHSPTTTLAFVSNAPGSKVTLPSYNRILRIAYADISLDPAGGNDPPEPSETPLEFEWGAIQESLLCSS